MPGLWPADLRERAAAGERGERTADAARPAGAGAPDPGAPLVAGPRRHARASARTAPRAAPLTAGVRGDASTRAGERRRRRPRRRARAGAR